jgi:hypothetical protein
MEREEMVQILEELIRSPETNPTAKCTAIRTLMEIAPDPPVAGDLFADLDEDVLPMRPRHARTKRAENSDVAPCAGDLLPQPGGFEGLGPSRVKAQAGDLPLAHRKNEPEVAFDRNAAALSTGCLMNPHQDVISGVEELLTGGRPIFKALGPIGSRLKEAFLAVIDGVIGVDAVRDQVISHQVDHVADIARSNAAKAPRTISTFSSDITYSRSPTASRASARSTYSSTRTTLPSRRVQTS